MIKLLTGAACAALSLVLIAAPAQADIVILRDGTVLPSKAAKYMPDPNEFPSDEALQKSGKGNLELGFDTIKISGKSVDAAEVQEIYCTRAVANAHFSNGMNQARSGFWDAGLPAFRSAAEELKGADKQLALWYGVLCASSLGGADAVSATKAAIDELLAEFPAGYFMPKAKIKQCRVLLNQGKAKSARDALDAVTSTKGMNSRDYFEAAVSKVDFFQLPRARKPDRAAKVEQLYRAILKEIVGRRAEQVAAIPMLRAQIGIGTCLIRQQKPTEAQTFFKDVVANKANKADKSVVASAQRGLGDVIYLQVAKQIRDGTAKDDKDGVLKQLDQAALRYLRVILLYRAEAGDALQPAMQSVAQVWHWQFDIVGGGDKAQLAIGKRALRYYIDSYKMMARGPARQEMYRHIKSFKDTVDALDAKLNPKEPADGKK